VQAADGCNAAAPSRTVTYQYNKGFLTGVPGYATNIAYQAGGMLHQITHANGVVYTMEINPADGLERPYRISTTAGWDTGTYAYDGAGNIHRIGTENFRYDRLSRLVSGQVKVGVSLRAQTAAFDVYGNITALTTNGSVQSTPTDPTTNRLQSPLASYDGGGNVTVLDYGSERYEYAYDGTNMMKYLKSDTGLARTFLYTASEERIVQLDCETAACGVDAAKHTWTLRGPGAESLRIYTYRPGREWEWSKDHIHRNGKSLAAVSTNGVSHLHPDHLGSPRQITRSGGGQESLHSYYPFGQEATGAAQDDVVLKFTGHERDSNDGRAKGALDYMHARHCSPTVGRFFSIDRAQADPRAPQSWDKYTYSHGNPIRYVDPDGRKPLDATWLQFFNALFHQDFSGVDIQTGVIAHAITRRAGAEGLTLGDSVYLNPILSTTYEKRATAGVSTIGHELTHVLYYRHLGGKRFMDAYLQNYNYNRIQGQSHNQAYRNIILEEVAFKVEKVISGFLADNSDIADKLKSGGSLSEEELERIGSALRDAAENGEIKEGFQFIHGFLVNIQFPPE
jgi:RHS repeat-associated protein